MNKQLTKKEQAIVSVMCDLFDKGNPETRIAKYALENKLTLKQLNILLFKLNLPFGYAPKIRLMYEIMVRYPPYLDNAQFAGKVLREFLNQTELKET